MIFLGPPGSGKGTQATRLSSELQVPAISTGEILRQACHSGSELGKLVRSVLEAGQLVGDQLMNEVVSRRLLEEDCRDGCILDGYPRTIAQARFLADWLAARHLPAPVVVDFRLPASHIESRLSQRRQCGKCGRSYGPNPKTGAAQIRCELDGAPLLQRSDDRPEVIRARLKLYKQNAEDLVQFFRSQNYTRLGAAGSPDDVFHNLLRAIGLDHAEPGMPRLPHATSLPAYGL